MQYNWLSGFHIECTEFETDFYVVEHGEGDVRVTQIGDDGDVSVFFSERDFKAYGIDMSDVLEWNVETAKMIVERLLDHWQKQIEEDVE